MSCIKNKCKNETVEKMPGCEHAMCRPCFLKLRNDKCPECGAGWENEELTYRVDNKYVLTVWHRNKRLSKNGEPNMMIADPKLHERYNEMETVVPWEARPIEFLFERELSRLERMGFDEIAMLRKLHVKKWLKNCSGDETYKYDRKSKCYFITDSDGNPSQDGAFAVYTELMPIQTVAEDAAGPVTVKIGHEKMPSDSLIRASKWYYARHKNMTISEFEKSSKRVKTAVQ